MQHRIIGPVVVQINKSEVLEPGLYSVTPKVTSWDAPGHIPLDEQLMHFTPDTDFYNNPKPEQWSFDNAFVPDGSYRLEKYHVDWPLAGHILTTPDQSSRVLPVVIPQDGPERLVTTGKPRSHGTNKTAAPAKTQGGGP